MVRLRLRRVVAADGGVDRRDVLAILSLLGPVAIVAGTATGPHNPVWWVTHPSMPETPWWQQFLGAPMWMIWVVVIVLAIARRRRAAAVGAWLGTADLMLRAVFYSSQTWWTGGGTGWVLLGLLTAVALTWSPGPAQAREFVRWLAIVPMATAVFAVVMIGVLAYHKQLLDWRIAVLAVGTVLACRPWSRVGRRTTVMFLVPGMIVLLGRIVLFGIDALPDYDSPTVTEVALCYGVPVVALLALGGVPRRVRQLT